jgi:O-methyltransferase
MIAMHALERRLRSLLRPVKHALRGRPPENPLHLIVEQELPRRYPMYRRAVEYVDFELVPGDIMEFGVYGGFSLALFAESCRLRWDRELERRVVGFDSFLGLPDDHEGHPRWKAGDCANVRGWHPTVDATGKVTPEATYLLFDRCELPRPVLEPGWFEETLPRVLGSKYTQAAIVHVDCDLYEPARFVLDQIEPLLQDGTVLLFDDWFHYKADPGKGEARAFREFLAAHEHWEAIPYQAYGTCSQSFIMHRR